jgi:hypothetical protein
MRRNLRSNHWLFNTERFSHAEQTCIENISKVRHLNRRGRVLKVRSQIKYLFLTSQPLFRSLLAYHILIKHALYNFTDNYEGEGEIA